MLAFWKESKHKINTGSPTESWLRDQFKIDWAIDIIIIPFTIEIKYISRDDGSHGWEFN